MQQAQVLSDTYNKIMKQQSTAPFEKQIRVIVFGILFCFGCIGGMLWYLQLYQAALFTQVSQNNYMRKRTLSCRRGAITDRNGILIATDRPIIALYWQGCGCKKLSEQHQKLLAHIQAESNQKLPIARTITQAEQYQQKLLLVDNISFEALARIMEYNNADEHLIIETRPLRYYPHQETACHLIGCFRQTPQTTIPEALMGLEKILEEDLRGNPGLEEIIVDSRGRCITKNIRFQALNGTKITTTIDLLAQNIAEKLLAPFRAGTIIVMDPEQGDLLVLASHPSFDPNIFTSTISPETWNNYLATKPFINRAIASCYPPASLFKLITAAAALEEGIITPDTEWNCTGKIVCGDTEFHCNKRYGHGKLQIIDGIAHSCNIPFYEIGKTISIDLFADYARSFGFGKPTGILLPERTGLIPTSEWKKTTTGQRWQRGETMLVAIGQSYSLVTPLQTVCFIGALGSGRLVRPKILCNENTNITPLAISNETRNILLQGMQKGIEQGTSRLLKRLKNCTIYGKTGTAQVCSKKTSGENQEEEAYKNHGWFAGYIVPHNQKPFVLMVFLENIGTSSIAVQTAYKFLHHWLPKTM